MDSPPPHAPQRWSALAALGGLNVLCIGLSNLVSVRLSWPWSFGIVLFVQVTFFIMLCFVLARFTSLYSQHPAFQAHGPSAAIIARMERTRIGLLAVDGVGGAIAILLGVGLLIVDGLFEPYQVGEQPLMRAIEIVLFALGFALLAHCADLYARNPPPCTHAMREHQQPRACSRLRGVP